MLRCRGSRPWAQPRRQGLLRAPLPGSRFGLILRLEPYDEKTLAGIVRRSARLLSVDITSAGAVLTNGHDARALDLPHRQPFVRRWSRDYAQVRAQGHIDDQVAKAALDLLQVDHYGLDEVDRKIMLTVLEKYSGGPVGLQHHRCFDR